MYAVGIRVEIEAEMWQIVIEHKLSLECCAIDTSLVCVSFAKHRLSSYPAIESCVRMTFEYSFTVRSRRRSARREPTCRILERSRSALSLCHRCTRFAAATPVELLAGPQRHRGRRRRHEPDEGDIGCDTGSPLRRTWRRCPPGRFLRPVERAAAVWGSAACSRSDLR